MIDVPRSFELGLNKIFRSRWGVTLVLFVVVLGVVGIGRLFAGGNDDNPVVGSASPATIASVDPSDDAAKIEAEYFTRSLIAQAEWPTLAKTLAGGNKTDIDQGLRIAKGITRSARPLW